MAIPVDATLRTDILRERTARVKAPLRRFAALTRAMRSRSSLGTYRSVAQERMLIEQQLGADGQRQRDGQRPVQAMVVIHERTRGATTDRATARA